MIEREIDECGRCHGTGRVATKGTTIAVLCSCPAGRHMAARPIRVFFWPALGTSPDRSAFDRVMVSRG